MQLIAQKSYGKDMTCHVVFCSKVSCSLVRTEVSGFEAPFLPPTFPTSLFFFGGGGRGDKESFSYAFVITANFFFSPIDFVVLFLYFMIFCVEDFCWIAFASFVSS